MRKILLLVALSVLWTGYARAQQTLGPVAEQVRKEIMTLEREKVPLLLQGGAAFAEWLEKVDDVDAVFTGPDGGSNNKAVQVAKWRNGDVTQNLNYQHDHEVFVYNNGRVAIMTYVGTLDVNIRGKRVTEIMRAADTWVKQNGKWLRVAHANAGMSADPRMKASVGAE
jgi:hypothetical protein